MKRIKAMNGYTIYEVTARDEKQGNGTAGEYAVFFSSDIRDYGVAYSTPEWDGIDSLDVAMELISDPEAVEVAEVKEELEQESTAVSFEDIEERIAERKQEERTKVTVTYNFGSVVTIGVKMNGRTLEEAILAYSEDIEGAIIDGEYRQLRNFEQEQEETEEEEQGDLFETIRAEADAQQTRSAWSKGVNSYAHELIDDLQEAIEGGYFDRDDLNAPNLVEKALLNGAGDWVQYSWGGYSLIYDYQIAHRLCNPSELKKTDNGRKDPNPREQWLDTQARALFQAAQIVKDAVRKAVEA